MTSQSFEIPIFLKIAQELENAILAGAFMEEEQVPSITELSVHYGINPATALKGINLLVDSDILYKKRGVGMFVKSGALDKLVTKRKDNFYQNHVVPLVEEAKHIAIPKEEVQHMIEKGYAAKKEEDE